MLKRVVRWVLIPLVVVVLVLVAVANLLAEPEVLRPQDFAAQAITLPSGETLAFASYLERLERGDFEPRPAEVERAAMPGAAAEAGRDADSSTDSAPVGALRGDSSEPEILLTSWPPPPDPNDPFSMGRWAYHEGRYEEALALLSGVDEQHPQYGRAQRYLGWDLLTKTQNRPRAGLAYMNRALGSDPTDGNNWQDAARVYLRAVGVRFDPVHGEWDD
ncbi:MAG: hypothetical protein DHS20C15_30230 [Planctomycetota bacterium]|nr:MAG: hypothetical protein DHS20C15_30230 [Planctomycetota bacterium]